VVIPYIQPETAVRVAVQPAVAVPISGVFCVASSQGESGVAGCVNVLASDVVEGPLSALLVSTRDQMRTPRWTKCYALAGNVANRFRSLT